MLAIAFQDALMFSLHAGDSAVNAEVKTRLKLSQGVIPVNCHMGADAAIALLKYGTY